MFWRQQRSRVGGWFARAETNRSNELPSRCEIPDEIDECVGKLEDELMECVSDSIAETLNSIMQLPGDQEPDENEIKCSMYETVSRCVVKKVEDNCGKEAGQIALAEMVDAPEDIKENCQLPNARDALKGLMYDIAKRRKK
ncbi:unnamed protein product [Larinioides sclopetarius]|uniref:T20D4.11-like domain-containing protein n=1 Tax=Larinioides sclopetarius TaxID=280406 RepID=A0AAV1ZTA4_9ARAC